MTGSVLAVGLLLSQPPPLPVPQGAAPAVAWRVLTPPGSAAELAPDGTSFLVKQEPASVECRGAASEKVRWRYASAAEVVRSDGVVLPGGDLALLEQSERRSTLVVLRASDGAVRWRHALKDGSGGRVVPLGATLVGLQDSLDTLVALEGATGAVKWRFASPAKCGAPSRRGMLVGVRARGRHVLATVQCEEARVFQHVLLDASTGAKRWTVEATTRLFWPADERLFRADDAGIAEIDVRTGKSRALPSVVALPPSRGRVELRAIGADGSLYFFNSGFTNFPGAPSEEASWWVAAPGATKVTRLEGASPPASADDGERASYGPTSLVRRVVLLDGGRGAVVFAGEVGATGRLGLVRATAGTLSADQATDALQVAP